jgi:diaminohydroxyphosphoribosylaminopyrimidine deaminase/5-amino-6-(5-phosphoribosylamino)uracil reductase
MTEYHESWMRRAIELAERGRGYVEPNPLVGAVLVKDGQVVGEGWHEKFGAAHAEVNAIRAAGEQARGATLYVTLEPCCHHGKTPPCTDAVLAAGIARVFAALEDPFPQVAGQGAKILRDRGVPIDFGFCAAEARRQNAPYLTLLTLGRPHVHGKWAMTLDGKIATVAGESKWISGDESRRIVHELRGRMDGILVGIGTALADDPLLTARPPGPRTACRVVLDREGRLPTTSQLVQTASKVPTLIVVGEAADEVRTRVLRDAGCEVIRVPTEASRLSIAALLAEFGRRRWTNLLVEGGGEVLAGFLAAGALDEVHAFIAPKIFGGRDARTPVEGDGFKELTQTLMFPHSHVEAIGTDAYVHAWK